MFEQLLGSKTRYKLLQLFIRHPDGYYYVRQLTRLLDTQINSVRRELLHLEKVGVLCSLSEIEVARDIHLLSNLKEGQRQTKSGSQKKYFRLNRNFFLYPELRGLFLKEQLFCEDNLVKNLRKIGTIHYLAITGVFLGVEDLVKTDILIIGRVDKEKLSRCITDYEKLITKEINYTVFSYKEYKYRLSINDLFLHAIFSNKKMVVIDELHEADEHEGGGSTLPPQSLVEQCV